jgi:hypothetical protein
MAAEEDLVFRSVLGISLLIAVFLLAPLALAEPAPSSAEATLSSSSSAANGRVAINIAAGVSNQEANSAVLAQGGAALANGSVHQLLKSSGVTGGDATATIGANALANASGLVAVNVAAGHENQLGNLAVIAIGIEAVAATESMLAQSRASQQPYGTTDPSSPDAHVADLSATAFSGSSGLVQSNLIGGERNSSSNSFALTMLGEDPL